MLELSKPGDTGTFGTIASSHDVVHHIGGLDDTNRNMTRRLLLLLESTAVVNPLIRSRVIRAVLDRYVVWGRGLASRTAGGFRVPRFLLNDVVRFWRTVAVDYAAKKWSRPTRNGAAERQAPLHSEDDVREGLAPLLRLRTFSRP